MSKLDNLKKASTLADVARLLGYRAKSLSYIIYVVPEDQKYVTFTTPKKTGGLRRIDAPIPKLKKVQRRLAELLNDCAEEILPPEEKIVHSPNEKQTRRRSDRSAAHGYKKGLSIATNADRHKNKKFVLNLDLEDFFPSINFGRVRGFSSRTKTSNLRQILRLFLLRSPVTRMRCHKVVLAPLLYRTSLGRYLMPA